jgi:Zn2+/Cd2+-exporting ATPase
VDDGDTSRIPPTAEPNVVVGFWRYLVQQVETQLALIAAGVILLSFGAGWLGAPRWAVVGLQLAALILAGWPIARSGLVNLWVNRSLTSIS